LWRARRLLGQIVSSPSIARSETDAAARAEAREQVRALLERVRKLQKEQQDVIALCAWSGLSYEEAAVALSVPVGTVRSRLSRARVALAELEPSSRHAVNTKSQRGEVIP
jgi:RNA polymerase sigma-70 factor (ECF subfamily)